MHRLRKHGERAFTLIELLIVMSIIIVLAGLVIATSGYVQEKSKRSRTEAEIAAMSAALESYKADNGIYPTNQATEALNPSVASSTNYDAAGKFLYGELTGDRDWDGGTNPNDKSYMTFKPATLQRGNMSLPVSASNQVTGVRDPFGTLYGYSTMKATAPNPGTVGGYNPTFDLWSTAGTSGTTPSDQAKWIKNW